MPHDLYVAGGTVRIDGRIEGDLFVAGGRSTSVARWERDGERPLPSLGFGALGFIGFFAALLALFIGMATLAIPLGVLGLGRVVFAVVFGVLLGSAMRSYLFVPVLLFVAAAVVGLTLGQFELERLNPSWAGRPIVALLEGVFVIVILTAIPVIGGLLNAAVALLGLGALMLRFWPRRSVPAAAGVAAPMASSQ